MNFIDLLVGWFSDPGKAALAQWCITIVALLLSIFATIRNRKMQGRILAIEEERRRSQLKIVIREHEMIVQNVGFSEARSVTINVDEKSIMEHEILDISESQAIEYLLNKLIVASTIGPQSEVRLRMLLRPSALPPWNVLLEWEDQSNRPDRYQTTVVNFPSR